MHASATDSKTAWAVVPGLLILAWAQLFAACGPRVQVEGPREVPTPLASPESRPASQAGGREVAVGELCMDRGAGRPAVTVLAARRTAFFTTESAELRALIERGALQHFVALSREGQRAGVFTVAGAAEVAPGEKPLAAGAYAGTPPSGTSCSLVVAGISRHPEDEGIPLATGGACVDGGRLVVDLDRDGKAESFPLAAFHDELYAPADEIVGEPGGSPSCQARFATEGLLESADPKAWRGIDLVAVLDLDADGRHELILRYRYDGKDTWAIYSAWRLATRLELGAEAEL
jgi:hypothetical protein